MQAASVNRCIIVQELSFIFTHLVIDVLTLKTLLRGRNTRPENMKTNGRGFMRLPVYTYTMINEFLRSARSTSPGGLAAAGVTQHPAD